MFVVLLAFGGACFHPPDRGDDDACAGPLGPPVTDLQSLTACCESEDGDGHCLDGGRVPDAIRPFVAGCAGGGYCIPDDMLITGGAVPPLACTAFGGAGVCLSVCIPQVHANAGVLDADTCGGDALCVPCVNPADGMPTGACDLIDLARCEGDAGDTPDPAACDDPATCAYDAGCPAVIDPSGLVACGDDAHCVDAAAVAAVDPDVVAQLAPCTDPSQVCVPDPFLRTGGKLVPATCDSIAGAEGRCLSTALPAIADRAGLLPQATCAASERCAPCFDPLDGAATGACALSCDPGPARGPTTLPACCEGRARCAAATTIPAAAGAVLEQAECAAASLCIPDQLLAGGPFPSCEASGLFGDYTGVCLSDCIDLGIEEVALDRGTCAADFLCVPCLDDGEPTGAPGCE
jgi:hypothetical protein